MKFILLAAAAVIATPVIAQETPGTAPTDQTAPAPADQAMGAPQGDASTAPPPAGDPSMQQPMTPPSGGGMASAPSDPNAGDPAGGYAPAAAPTGPAAPGARVVFQQAPSPTEAFPPPAPMAKYPICKKGQYDNCMQRGGR